MAETVLTKYTPKDLKVIRKYDGARDVAIMLY